MRRAVGLIPTLLLISVISFGLLSLVPGDPASSVLGENASKSAVQQVRQDLGLNRPIVVRYASWLGGALHGNFGRSFIDRRPVSQQIKQRLPVTLELTLAAMLLATLVAVPLGVIAGLRWGTSLDRVITAISVAGIAVPNFFLAVLLVLVFGIKLKWLPVLGWASLARSPGSNFRFILLPMLTLAVAPMAVIARMVRASIAETVRTDYVRTARAKGLSELVVIVRHALRNSLIATITIIGLQTGVLLGGSIIIESLFGLPGLGLLSLHATSQHDYPVLQAVVLVMASGVLIANLLVDVSYVFLDPRIRYA